MTTPFGFDRVRVVLFLVHLSLTSLRLNLLEVSVLLTQLFGDYLVESAVDRFVFFFALLHAAISLLNMVWIQSVSRESTPWLGLDGFGMSSGCISPPQNIDMLVEDSNIGNRIG